MFNRYFSTNRTILKYYLYQATASFGFTWPIFTLFLLKRGLSFSEIALLSALSAGITTMSEIPTGFIGDRIGRRNSMLVGMLFLTLFPVVATVAHSLALFVVVFILWGLAHTFQSGSSAAWLYDTLKADLSEEQFTVINGRGVSINQGATALTMLAGGVLYSVDPILPFLAGTGLHALGLAVLLSLPKNPQYANSGADQASQKPFTISKALPLIRRKLTSSSLRSTVVYLALFIAAIRATQDYVQPISTTTLGLPVASIGVLYAGFITAAAIAGYHAETLKGKFGIQEVVTGVPLMLGLFLLGSIFVPLLSLVAFFMLQTSEAALRPIVGQYLNDQIASVGRATVLSSISMLNGIVQLPLYVLAGMVADRNTPLVAIATIGGILLAGWVVIQSIEPPVSHPEGQTSTSQKTA